jgi:hypothetical protein
MAWSLILRRRRDSITKHSAQTSEATMNIDGENLGQVDINNTVSMLELDWFLLMQTCATY